MYDFDNNNLYDYYTENQKKKKKKSTIETNKWVDIFLLQVITMSPPWQFPVSL